MVGCALLKTEMNKDLSGDYISKAMGSLPPVGPDLQPRTGATFADPAVKRT